MGNNRFQITYWSYYLAIRQFQAKNIQIQFSIKMIMKSLTLIVAVAATGEFWAMNPDCPDIDGKFGLI